MDWYKLAGRVLIGSLFLVAGFAKITNVTGAEQMVAQGGFPVPALFTMLAIVFEFGGALLLISGFHARLAAWGLVVFTAIATVAYHNPATSPMAALMFEKNLAIIGGLIYVVAAGAGKYSLAKWNTKFCKGGKYCPDCRTCGVGQAPAQEQNQQQEQQHQDHQEHHQQ